MAKQKPDKDEDKDDKETDSLLTKFLGSLSTVTGAFQGLTGAMSGFVAALSPATMLQFQQAMADLSAVIGVALQPLMDAAISIAKEVGDALLPVMEQLRPIMEELADIIVSTLSPVINAVSLMLQALVPVIKPVLDILKAAAVIFQTVVHVVTALVASILDAIGGLFANKAGEGVKSFTEMLVEMTQKLAKGFLILIGALAKWMGAMGFLDRLIKGLSGDAAGKKSSAGIAAPGQASITDLRGFGNAVMTAAFTATPGGRQKTQEDWLAETVDELKAIRRGAGMDWGGIIEKAIKDALRSLQRTYTKEMENRWGKSVFDPSRKAGERGNVYGDDLILWLLGYDFTA